MATEVTLKGLLSPMYIDLPFTDVLNEINLQMAQSHEFILLAGPSQSPVALSMRNTLCLREVDDEYADASS